METVMGGAVKQLLATAASGKPVTASVVQAQLSAANETMKADLGIE
jgi:hypothetical protein